MSPRQRLLLLLRVLMELGVVGGLAYWGAHTGDSVATKVVLAVAAPVVGFGFWGAVDFHRAGRLSEPLRLAQELAVSLLAAAAFWAAGQHGFGIGLAAVSLAYHALVYASGERLLKTRTDSPQRNESPERRPARS